ncbi:MAG: hypothetical protein IIC53_14010 [Proteobacteria bacterium]|nr:hypothetical protein [Pseudomonadota bacterium]
MENTRKILAHFNNPQIKTRTIHIAGTNGKTSTARLATWLLVAHDLNTGTYTSPHLQKVEERLAVNGRFAAQEEFALAVSDAAAFADVQDLGAPLAPEGAAP